MVLEKTLESPLEYKEMQPVCFKGDQSWVFIRRTDAEAEAPIFGHLMQRADSLEKTLMLVMIERNSRKTTWFPPLGKMRPLPATASQGKSPVPP